VVILLFFESMWAIFFSRSSCVLIERRASAPKLNTPDNAAYALSLLLRCSGKIAVVMKKISASDAHNFQEYDRYD
jgi:hypothetical protein